MTTAQMPPPDATVSQHIVALARSRGGRPVLIDAARGAAAISYSAFAATVCAAAAGLTRRGMRPGDVTGIYVTGPVTFALASHAIRAAGGVPSPMGPTACRDALASRLTRCDARMVITDAALAVAAHDVTEHSRVRQLICFGYSGDTTRFDALLHGGTMPPLPGARDDLAMVAWTSGPRGEPRPVPVTQCELRAQLLRLATTLRLTACDVVVAGPPSGDGRGYSALLDLALVAGATVVGAPSAGTADMLAVSRSHHGTVAMLPPHTKLPCERLRAITVQP